jgi:hypothetical protein
MEDFIHQFLDDACIKNGACPPLPRLFAGGYRVSPFLEWTPFYPLKFGAWNGLTDLTHDSVVKQIWVQTALDPPFCCQTPSCTILAFEHGMTVDFPFTSNHKCANTAMKANMSLSENQKKWLLYHHVPREIAIFIGETFLLPSGNQRCHHLVRWSPQL